MEADYWHRKWSEGHIGFHQSEANKRLMRYWSELGVRRGCPVFVPLCGKSLDMLWLHREGHPVVGVELSETACQAFFEENGLPCVRRETPPFIRFEGRAEAEGLTLLAGDFFELQPSDLEPCKAFYDRASLIAMNDTLRRNYAEHLAMILPGGAQGLLLTIDYNPGKMQGPPFPVPDALARSLLEPAFQIRELAHYAGPERVGNLAERGLDTLDEYVYGLERMRA